MRRTGRVSGSTLRSRRRPSWAAFPLEGFLKVFRVLLGFCHQRGELCLSTRNWPACTESRRCLDLLTVKNKCSSELWSVSVWCEILDAV